MNTNNWPFVLLYTTFVLLTLAACSSLKGEAKKEPSWSLELKKGGCMDVCSSYSISISNGGQFKYKGLYMVKHFGEKSGKLNHADLSKLQDMLQTIDWNPLDSSYGQHTEGTARKELSYTSTAINKKIIYYRLEPQEIRQLEHLIDTIIDHDEF